MDSFRWRCRFAPVGAEAGRDEGGRSNLPEMCGIGGGVSVMYAFMCNSTLRPSASRIKACLGRVLLGRLVIKASDLLKNKKGEDWNIGCNPTPRPCKEGRRRTPPHLPAAAPATTARLAAQRGPQSRYEIAPMRILSRWISRLSPSAHRLASTARPLHNASASPRWKPSEIAQQVPPSFPTACSPTRRVPRFPHRYRHMASSSEVIGEDLPKPLSAKDFIISLGKRPSTITQGLENVEDVHTTKVITRYTYVPPAKSVEDETRPSGDAIFGELSSVDKENLAAAEIPDYVPPMEIFPNSSHRDGSIYCGTDDWKVDYRIADRNETWLDAMMFSDPTDCRMYDGTCVSHSSRHMLQFLSLRLAKIPAELGSVELYGYIAARDNLNPLLNYIVNFSRDDPIIVKQGSLINMAGPKRGIELVGTILIEYDMKIKAGEHEKEDLQVIDGVSCLDNIDTWDRRPFTLRIHGDCGAIDVGVSRLNFAYEATIEVVVSQVQSSFSMRLGCFTSGLHEEIRLFDGAIGEPGGLKRSVVAVASNDQMELKFKVAADSCIPAEYCCCFEAKQHGRATQEINTGFALIAVKVTWSTLIEDEE